MCRRTCWQSPTGSSDLNVEGTFSQSSLVWAKNHWDGFLASPILQTSIGIKTRHMYFIFNAMKLTARNWLELFQIWSVFNHGWSRRDSHVSWSRLVSWFNRTFKTRNFVLQCLAPCPAALQRHWSLWVSPIKAVSNIITQTMRRGNS